MATERQSRALCMKMRQWRACISYGKNELCAASSRRERKTEIREKEMN